MDDFISIVFIVLSYFLGCFLGWVFCKYYNEDASLEKEGRNNE